MLTSLVSLPQENVKKSKKLAKIVNIEAKIFMASERIEEFQ